MAGPFILINLKTYRESIGQHAHRLASVAQAVSADSGVTIGIAPSYLDIHPLSRHYDIPVFAQHVDGTEPGAHTGSVIAEALRQAGAKGSLVNHSERRLTLADIEAAVSALRSAHMVSVVCTNNEAASTAAAALSPDYVAVEPPELIGSGVSVAKANPDIIKKTVDAVRLVNPKVRVLTGAGIQTGECVRTAIDLGTDGVLLASGVVKAKDPEAVLRDLVSKI